MGLNAIIVRSCLDHLHTQFRQFLSCRGIALHGRVPDSVPVQGVTEPRERLRHTYPMPLNIASLIADMRRALSKIVRTRRCSL